MTELATTPTYVEIETMLQDRMLKKVIPRANLIAPNDALLVYEQSIEVAVLLSQDIVPINGLKKMFPCIIRDAIVVSTNILVFLETGMLIVLDRNLEVVKKVQVALKSFTQKPAPPLEMHQSLNEQGFVTVQVSDKKINLYPIKALTEPKVSAEPVTSFAEPNQNTIFDYQLLYDWRKASEELDGETLPETLLVATLTLDPAREQTVVSIHRLYLCAMTEASKREAQQQIFILSSAMLSTRQQQNFTKLSSQWESPILSIFTDQQVIFLDQRKLQMINYNFSPESNFEEVKEIKKFSPQQVQSLQVCVNSIQYQLINEEELCMFCFLDSKEIYRFKFGEDYSIDKIESKVKKDKRLPVSGIIVQVMDGNEVWVINQTGYSKTLRFMMNESEENQESEKAEVGEWSLEADSIIKNIGPVTDFKVTGPSSLLCTAGLAPTSALYELKQGVSLSTDCLKLTFDTQLDEIWFFTSSTGETFSLVKTMDQTQFLLSHSSDFTTYNLHQALSNFEDHSILLDSNCIELFQPPHSNFLLQILEAPSTQRLLRVVSVGPQIQLIESFELCPGDRKIEINSNTDGKMVIAVTISYETSQHYIASYEISIRMGDGTQYIEMKKRDLELVGAMGLENGRQIISGFINGKASGQFIVSIYDLAENISKVYLINNNEQRQLIIIQEAQVTEFAYYDQLLFAALSNGKLVLLDISTSSVLHELKLFDIDTYFNFKSTAESLYCLPRATSSKLYSHPIIHLSLKGPLTPQPLLSTEAVSDVFSLSPTLTAFLSSDKTSLILSKALTGPSYQHRLIYKPSNQNQVIRRLVEIREGVYGLVAEAAEEDQKSELVIYDTNKHVVLHKMQTEKITEIACLSFQSDEECSKQDPILVIGFANKEFDGLKGRVRLCKLIYSKKKGLYEVQQVAPSSEFPHAIASICTNFRDTNDIVIGSGQYLFMFKVLKTSFEYSMKSIHYTRMRAPIRSVNWSWTDRNSLKPKYSKVKESKQHNYQVAQLIIADSEEGVSLYTFDPKANQLKLRGFDIGVKQALYANALPNMNSLACLDYYGNFSIIEDIRDNINPLLRYNKESVFDHSFNQLIRKFDWVRDTNEMRLMSLRGALISLKLTCNSEELEKEHQLSLIYNKSNLINQSDQDIEETQTDEDKKYRVIDRDMLNYGALSALERVEFETQQNMKESAAMI